MITHWIRSAVPTTIVLGLLSATCSSEAAGTGTAALEPEGTTSGSLTTESGAATSSTRPAPTTIEPNTAEYEAFRAAPTACRGERPEPVSRMQFDHPASQGLDPTKSIRVVMETSCGNLGIELDPSLAPIAVNSFVFLTRKGYFDGSASHRIVSGFMFQAGDPTARGNGRPGYLLAIDEWPEPGFAYERGVVAMANAGPTSTGSQFFIMLDDYSLAPNYTVIGRVVDGDEVLDAIGGIPVTDNGKGEISRPAETLYLERVVVDD